ncbi:hypothetical protein CDAR_83671 [Caerostris darwini]|uniref:Uncharacterized protein n=1 Tax=Caerostris darwini TaxID=1538125 RepID=A0AAV4QIA2_9ARAC|nr:hypothetical protein CDAR_83671 [Caerostris darwini]
MIRRHNTRIRLERFNKHITFATFPMPGIKPGQEPGVKCLNVISDYFTRYAEAYPISDIQKSTVARVLIDFISRPDLSTQTVVLIFLSATMNEVHDIVADIFEFRTLA